MRISDWSSDVCSSDLCLTSLEEHVAVQIIAADRPVEPPPRIGDEPRFLDESLPDTVIEKIEGNRQTARTAKNDFAQPVLIPVPCGAERKSVLEGKRVVVRVVCGGRT